MENSINKQFKMTPGSKEVDTQGTFKMTPAVANMGIPTNYGTADSPAPKTDPKKKETDAERRDRQSIGQRDGAVANRKGKIGGVTVRAKGIGKERGATDLLEEGKKVYRKVKNYFSS